MLFQGDLERFLATGGVFDPAYRAPGRGAEAVEEEEEEEQAVLNMDIDVEAILNSHEELTEEERIEQVHDSLLRILEMDNFFASALKVKDVKGGGQLEKDTQVSSRFGWMLIVSRMMTRGPGSFPKEDLISFIMKDFAKRIDLAIFWLFEEYLRGDQYEHWISYFLKCFRGELEGVAALDPTERILSRFLLEIPELSSFVLEDVRSYCDDLEK
jgi:hypothetical protein